MSAYLSYAALKCEQPANVAAGGVTTAIPPLQSTAAELRAEAELPQEVNIETKLLVDEADSIIRDIRNWSAARRASSAGLVAGFVPTDADTPSSILPSDGNGDSATLRAAELQACHGLAARHAERLAAAKESIPAFNGAARDGVEINSAPPVDASTLRDEAIALHATLLMKQKLAELGLDVDDGTKDATPGTVDPRA